MLLKLGILVFLTGQNEISILCKKLRRKFPYITRNQDTHNSEQLEEEGIISEAVEKVREGLTAKEGKLPVIYYAVFKYFYKFTNCTDVNCS